jgi:hypothetical protein
MVRDPRIVPLGLHADVVDTLAQHPLLEDTGDGIPSYSLAGTGEGALVASLKLGEGILVNALSSPADIKAVTPTLFIPPTESTGTIWLQANVNSRVGRAWAEIRVPDAGTSGGGSGQVVPALDMIPLIYDGIKWVGDYSFTTPGRYEIYYFTRDIQTDEISPMAHSVVYKQLAGNTPPTPFSLLTPDDEATPKPSFVLTWEDSFDADGLTYTLLVAPGPDFATIVHLQEDLPQAGTIINKDALLDPVANDGSYYCQNGNSYCSWKVQAIDKYGAITESDVRSFTIVATSGDAVFLRGTVRSAATFQGVRASVTLRNNIGPDLVAVAGVDGAYFLNVGMTGAFTLKAEASGYQPTVMPVNLMSQGAFSNIVQDITLATTAPATYSVGTSGANVTFTPALANVAADSTTQFTVTADSCYTITTVTGCGGSWNSGTGIYTTGPVTGSCTVSATSALKTLTITTAVSGGNGSIDPSTTVSCGDSKTIAFTPNSGYMVNTIFIDGNSFITKSMTSYTFTNVIADHSLTVSFTRVRIKGDGTPFHTLQDAFDQMNGGTIQAQVQDIVGDLTITSDYPFSLIGGLEETFTNRIGWTGIHGVFSVRHGQLTVEGVVIE